MNVDCRKTWNNVVKTLYYTSFAVLEISTFVNEVDASRVTPYTSKRSPAATQFDDWRTSTRPPGGTQFPNDVQNFGYGNSTILRVLCNGLFRGSEF